MAKMVHQAEKSQEGYMLLKLDMVKAFHKLEWPFIIAILKN
jgi:hypothetical protein